MTASWIFLHFDSCLNFLASNLVLINQLDMSFPYFSLFPFVFHPRTCMTTYSTRSCLSGTAIDPIWVFLRACFLWKLQTPLHVYLFFGLPKGVWQGREEYTRPRLETKIRGSVGRGLLTEFVGFCVCDDIMGGLIKEFFLPNVLFHCDFRLECDRDLFTLQVLRPISAIVFACPLLAIRAPTLLM